MADTPNSSSSNWAKENPERRKEIQKKYRQTDKYKKSYVSGHLKRTYGITTEDYYEILESQGNVCRICNKSDNRKVKVGTEQFLPLFVDHCHTTGEVRGLLCSKCNSGLGMFGDNIDFLISAISYLKENEIG